MSREVGSQGIGWLFQFKEGEFVILYFNGYFGGNRSYYIKILSCNITICSCKRVSLTALRVISRGEM